MSEKELESLGYKRVEYNYGALVAYMKAFNDVDDPQDYRACRVEVRFDEHPACPIRVYVMVPGHGLPLPGLKTIADVEALYELLKKGRQS